MPLKLYFGGHGDEVMAQMQLKHGEEAGEREFYATANKRGQGPRRRKSKKRRKYGFGKRHDD